MNKVPLTARGAEKLKQELNHLKTVMRPKITEAIAEARAHGDLKENAEYHAAREQQSFTEGRIIDVTQVNAHGKVVFGATVELADAESGDEVTYQIVGEDEADIKQGMISITSPIARALIGKREGDVATVNAPGGVREFDILAVRYV